MYLNDPFINLSPLKHIKNEWRIFIKNPTNKDEFSHICAVNQEGGINYTSWWNGQRGWLLY